MANYNTINENIINHVLNGSSMSLFVSAGQGNNSVLTLERVQI